MYKISLPCACDIAVLSQHIYPKQDQNAVHYGMVGLFCV